MQERAVLVGLKLKRLSPQKSYPQKKEVSTFHSPIFRLPKDLSSKQAGWGGQVNPSCSSWDIEDSLEELKLLSVTAGAYVTRVVIQHREKIDPAYFIGKGKAQEIKSIAEDNKANLVILDGDLSPSQQLNLEEEINLKVIDRTQLILDIFAQRAHTKEGKLQVELAQLNYLLPRLRGKGILLSRLGGGIGTRGPGETKLEVDRRHIRERIKSLKSHLKEVRKTRTLHRMERRRKNQPLVSLVGYTNSGKSTLLNSLSKAEVEVEDKLFATLDPTTRKVFLPSHQSIFLTDTVGFIHHLPHHLIAAFRATLEEVQEADLLLKVVDITHPRLIEHSLVVDQVLEELSASDKPKILVFNKIDKLKSQEIEGFKKRFPEGVFISALYQIGLDELLKKIDDFFNANLLKIKVIIPQSEGKLISFLYNHANIISLKYENDKMIIDLKIPNHLFAHLKDYVVM